MKILLIEDDPNKTKNIVSYLNELLLGSAAISLAASYNSAVDLLLKEAFSLVILDMTLPMFDTGPREDGFRHNAFAGREVLREIKRRAIVCSVFVMTQYETLGHGVD